MSNQVSVFDLDPTRLDEAWIEQPKIYHEYALLLADAGADLDRAKNARDLVEADLDRQIRMEPEKFSISGKLTEAMVEKTIKLQPAYHKACETVVNAQYKRNKLSADVDALDHRKRALEALVQLEARDYFSTPRAPFGSNVKRDKERKADAAFGSKKKIKKEED